MCCFEMNDTKAVYCSVIFTKTHRFRKEGTLVKIIAYYFELLVCLGNGDMAMSMNVCMNEYIYTLSTT